MMGRLLKFFFRDPRRAQTDGICGTPAIMSGELKLVDEVVDVQASNAASQNKEAAEESFYLPPPAWVNTDSDSRKPKHRK